MAEADELLLERRGALGLLTLNRPQALNALTLDMSERMAAQLYLPTSGKPPHCPSCTRG